jgi:hypothetical protein
MQTPSHTLLGIQHDREMSDEPSLSAIGKAFAQVDLNMVHTILLDDGYTEDDMVTSEVSYLFAIVTLAPSTLIAVVLLCFTAFS